MSREIKFRVWHKKANYMCMNVTTDLLNKDYVVFMQYTGLKDKNGKEIYEGDIVSFYNDEEYRFKSTNALVIYDSAAFMLEHKKLGKEYLGEMDIENMGIKIIGNIYENPELLEREE